MRHKSFLLFKYFNHKAVEQWLQDSMSEALVSGATQILPAKKLDEATQWHTGKCYKPSYAPMSLNSVQPKAPITDGSGLLCFILFDFKFGGLSAIRHNVLADAVLVCRDVVIYNFYSIFYSIFLA